MLEDKRLVKVVSYDSHWPEKFTSEANRIKEALGDNCIAIHHIGSTAIPGLTAKPIIDIVPVVKNLLAVDPKIHFMKQLGYESKGEYGIAFRRFFQKGNPTRTFNVHIYEENSPEIEHALLFRDYLIAHPAEKERYSALKVELAQTHPDDLDAYWLGKEAFIYEINQKSGFHGYRMLQALTPREWEAYHQLHEMNDLKSKNVTLSPDHLNISDKNHYHFVFAMGTQIIGAAHIQFIHDNQATIRTCVIDLKYRDPKTQDQNHEANFRTWLRKWIQQQGRTFKQ